MLTQTKSDRMQVFSTRDYDHFKDILGNRNLNLLHLKRLEKSMSINALISPLIVNEKFEIIDGQHRFFVRKKLNLPIQYIIAEGYGLKEVQILNSNNRGHTPEDAMVGYIELGLEDYGLYKKFKEQFGFGHQETLAILSDRDNFSYEGPAFRNGFLKIKDYRQAVITAEKLMTLAPYYNGYKGRRFVSAMLTCFKKKDYNHSLFLSKLEYQRTKLVVCTNVKQYLTLIEEIYNYRNSSKINLRFDK